MENTLIQFNETDIRIITLMCEDMTSKQIGKAMNMSNRTVENHQYRIMKKMDVHTKLGVIQYALRHKICQLP